MLENATFLNKGSAGCQKWAVAIQVRPSSVTSLVLLQQHKEELLRLLAALRCIHRTDAHQVPLAWHVCVSRPVWQEARVVQPAQAASTSELPAVRAIPPSKPDRKGALSTGLCRSYRGMDVPVAWGQPQYSALGPLQLVPCGC